MLRPRISVSNDLVDAGLVESFVALVALKDLQVGAEGPGLPKAIGLGGRDCAAASAASNRSASTGQDSPAVKACFRYGRSVNGLRTGTPERCNCCRAASKSKRHSKWCMPACNSASPCSRHHRPTVPNSARGRKG